jgi:polyhydroxybutyrate depolymerase
MTQTGRTRSILAGLLAGVLVAFAGGCRSDDPAASPSTAPSTAPTLAPQPTPAAGDHRAALIWDGLERGYELHAPPGFKPGSKLPLVVVMHYFPGDAEKMRQMTTFDAKADAEGFLVAYPNGISGGVNALVCCGEHDDVGFIKAMVEDLIARWGADPDRVYATGISNGADMSFRLAVEVPGMFAAIAPVSGGFIGNKASQDQSYAPRTPVSVISMIGTVDRGVDRFTAGIDIWQAKVGCTATPAAWADPQQTLSKTTASCTNGSEVVSYVIKGMGHSWPGGNNVGLGDPKTSINAVDTMWDFFKTHPRRS